MLRGDNAADLRVLLQSLINMGAGASSAESYKAEYDEVLATGVDKATAIRTLKDKYFAFVDNRWVSLACIRGNTLLS